MSSKVSRGFDAAEAVTLRSVDAGVVGADTSDAAVALNTLVNAKWDNDEVPNGVFSVSLVVDAISTSGGDEVYDFYIEVATTSAFSSPVEVARLKDIPSAGVYEIPISSKTIEKLVPGAKFIRSRVDVTGSAPVAIYGAWLTFLTH
jgi:hypothetical protein